MDSLVHQAQMDSQDHLDPQDLLGRWALLDKVDLRDNLVELELQEYQEVQVLQDLQGPLELLVLTVGLVLQGQRVVLAFQEQWEPQDSQGQLGLLDPLEAMEPPVTKGNQETSVQQDFRVP